jgi:hypothetical protein
MVNGNSLAVDLVTNVLAAPPAAVCAGMLAQMLL